MLFPYTYVPHQMDRMQEFIDFIFFEVWCKAPEAGDYDLDLFAANADLYEVMTAFHYSDTQVADFFAGHIQRIYELFADLSPENIRQWQAWYRANNDLEAVCANDPDVPRICYTDIQQIYPQLAEQLASFFKGLYDKLGTGALKKKIGHIDDHYTSFTTVNDVGTCPFCGISGLLGSEHDKRDAYDHYLPKAIYPFNAVNFHNLVPACHHCNSSYKGSKDPAGGEHRRKVFYPFSDQAHHIDLKVTLPHGDFSKLIPDDIKIEFGPEELAEEIATWKDVYGIEKRYKAKLSPHNDGKYWLEQALDEWPLHGENPELYLSLIKNRTKSRPYVESNFLKKAFLDACQRSGAMQEPL